MAGIKGKRVNLKCPYCGERFEDTASHVVRRKSCGKPGCKAKHLRKLFRERARDKSTAKFFR